MPAPAPITFWHWAVFILIILIFLLLDLGVFPRSSPVIKLKEALLRSAAWFCLAMLFAAGLRLWRGPGESLEFVAGYFVEYSLSMDNVAGITVIFASVGLAPRQQQRVLFWGIIGAFVMRGIMIWAGVALIRTFHWVLLALGVFLICTGTKWGFSKQTEPGKNPALWLARKLFPSSHPYDGSVTTFNGRALTPFALALVLVETTDLLFAFDSIPAVFSVTQNAFIVFTSNIFAILGLRSLYFAMAGALQSFRFLKAGLGVVLIFAGAKILADRWLAVPAVASIAVVGAIIACSTGLSLFLPKKEKTP